MAGKNVIISQCLNLVNQIVEKNMKVYMNVQMEEGVSFIFDNMEKRNKSASQEKRSIERSIKFKEKVKEKTGDENLNVGAKEKKSEIKPEVSKETDLKTEETRGESEQIETKEDVCESIMIAPLKVFVASDKQVENAIVKNLEDKGIGVERVIFKRDASRDLKMIEIQIKPMPKKKLEEANVTFRDLKILWMR